ncbi:MAG TPA: sigma-54 dependent transcriptional regulator [Pirellulaceae bacterium]|jgi:two-component system NtrC family response regulator|nr:sigma-54 dependent transcriptional regulator [Pirellulaceae bacterium]
MKKSETSEKPRERLRILFADDELTMQEVMRDYVTRLGHDVVVCPDGETAIAAIDEEDFDCALLDLDMPKRSGIEVMQFLKERSPTSEAVILTGNGNYRSAVDALRLGAHDYLSKPCSLKDLERLFSKVAERRKTNKLLLSLARRLEQVEGSPRLVGESLAMQRVASLIDRVGPTNSTVLILGETGVGKELVAQAVHKKSLRAEKPFVAINCGALPETLIESELFGHKRGAFTGADEHRIGLFEMADGGTLFLDEIGELPKAMQAKLLRALESGEIRRVGANETTKVDVRIICATHRNLADMVEQGDFREDLMYRINTFELRIPPLRERTTDIPQLARHLLKRCRPSLADGEEAFTKEALDLLCAHSWPGNVRELANVVEHASILCDELPIQASELPSRFDSRQAPKAKRTVGAMTLREMEFLAIEEALARHDGRKPDAAEELGISLKTLYNKLNQSELQDRERRAA